MENPTYPHYDELAGFASEAWEKLVGAVGIEPTTLNSNALPLQGLALCPLPEVPIQTPQTVLSFTSRDPRDDEPVLVDLKSHNVVYPTVWYL